MAGDKTQDYFPEEEDAPVLVVPVRRRYRKWREIRQEPTDERKSAIRGSTIRAARAGVI